MFVLAAWMSTYSFAALVPRESEIVNAPRKGDALASASACSTCVCSFVTSVCACFICSAISCSFVFGGAGGSAGEVPYCTATVEVAGKKSEPPLRALQPVYVKTTTTRIKPKNHWRSECMIGYKSRIPNIEYLKIPNT